MGLKLAGARRVNRGGFFGTGIYLAAMSDGSTEFPAAGAYARVGSTNIARWEADAVNGWHVNLDALDFPEPSAVLGAPAFGGFYDAQASGNLLFTADLTGDPAAPGLGASFGADARSMRLRFNGVGSKLTPRGSILAFTEGIVGGTSTTRYVSVHSAEPDATGSNQEDDSVPIAQTAWSEVGTQQNSIRNNAAVDFGIQATDLPDLMWVALREGAAANSAVLWKDAFDNNPDDPAVGDRLTFPENMITITATID